MFISDMTQRPYFAIKLFIFSKGLSSTKSDFLYFKYGFYLYKRYKNLPSEVCMCVRACVRVSVCIRICMYICIFIHVL